MNWNKRKLPEILDALMAYDDGATDSGIHDEQLRTRALEYLVSLSPQARAVEVERFLDLYRNEDYDQEDVDESREWISEQMRDYARRMSG